MADQKTPTRLLCIDGPLAGRWLDVGEPRVGLQYSAEQDENRVSYARYRFTMADDDKVVVWWYLATREHSFAEVLRWLLQSGHGEDGGLEVQERPRGLGESGWW